MINILYLTIRYFTDLSRDAVVLDFSFYFISRCSILA